jgi:hypothetical protein
MCNRCCVAEKHKFELQLRLRPQNEVAAFRAARPEFPVTYQLWESSHSLNVRPALHRAHACGSPHMRGPGSEPRTLSSPVADAGWSVIIYRISFRAVQKAQEIDYVVKWSADASFRG